ncbi:MAG TPA: YihY/virulence factor BrkB family protein, partial [Nitrospiraceae bacterium]|nr:YihY/virulence factor BrkB family protein [Nitrospiraceae bacterium]
AAFGKWFGSWLPAPELVLQALNLVISFGVITVLFAMMFKLLPDARIAWSDVWVGAAITALLFTLGKFLIGLYLGKSNVASAYGAAGSLVILLVWVYYSAQILLFGAEFTQVYANTSGARIVPTDQAVATDPKKAGGGVTPGQNGAKQDRPSPRGGTTPPTPAGDMPVHAATGAAAHRDRFQSAFRSDVPTFKPGDQGDRWAAALLLGFSMFQILRGRWGDRTDEPAGRS